jgi:hypothetical protein
MNSKPLITIMVVLVAVILLTALRRRIVAG